MENKIYNSFRTEIFVSLYVSKLIIYIYIFSYLEPALHKNVLFGDGFRPMHCKMPCGAVTDQATHYSRSVQYFLFIYEHIYSF